MQVDYSGKYAAQAESSSSICNSHTTKENQATNSAASLKHLLKKSSSSSSSSFSDKCIKTENAIDDMNDRRSRSSSSSSFDSLCAVADNYSLYTMKMPTNFQSKVFDVAESSAPL